MDQFVDYFKQKKNLTNLIILLILVITLPLGIYLAKKTQIFNPRAAAESITFLEGTCIQKNAVTGKLTAVCQDIKVSLVSPLGPPEGFTPAPSVTPSASPSPSVSPSVPPSVSPTPSSSTAVSHSPAPCDPKENDKEVVQETWAPGDIGQCKNKTQRVSYQCGNKKKTFSRSCPISQNFNFIGEVYAQRPDGAGPVAGEPEDDDTDGNPDSGVNPPGGIDDGPDSAPGEQDDDNNGSGGSKKRQCNDGKDNDKDGKIDSLDPGCHKDDDINKEYIPTDNKEKEGKGGNKDGDGFTQFYKISDNTNDLKKAPENKYDVEPKEVSFKLSSSKPGKKTIFVDFIGVNKKGNKKTERRSASIDFLGDAPIISNVACLVSASGSGSTLTITGNNFGSSKGAVKASGNNVSVNSWNNTEVTVSVSESCSQEIPVVVTRPDEQYATGLYSPTSQLSLGVKLFCRRPNETNVSGVELTYIEGKAGASLIRENVSISRQGTIEGMSTQLEKGKRYQLAIKAPRSVRRLAKAFVYQGGTTQVVLRKQDNYLDQIYYNVLPIGDIFPVSGDGAINGFDKTELNQEWGALPIGSTTLKPGDFNQDSVVNSIDWACMRYDFGASQDSEPEAPICPEASIVCDGGQQAVAGDPDPNDLKQCPIYYCSAVQPSISPTPAVSEAPSASPSPSLSPIPSPTEATSPSPTPSETASPSP